MPWLLKYGFDGEILSTQFEQPCSQYHRIVESDFSVLEEHLLLPARYEAEENTQVKQM